MARRRPEDDALAIAFGRRLKHLRVERRMTQERLAEAAGFHPTFVSNLERGYRMPTLGTLVRVAEALEVRLGELLDAMEHEADAPPIAPPSERRTTRPPGR